MLSVFGEIWGKADNLLNVFEISLCRACAELSNIINRIRQLATQIIKSKLGSFPTVWWNLVIRYRSSSFHLRLKPTKLNKYFVIANWQFWRSNQQSSRLISDGSNITSFYIFCPVIRSTIFRAKGTSNAAVGNPTRKPTNHARNQVRRNESANPTFIATMTNDITQPIPKAIITPISGPSNLGLIDTCLSPFNENEFYLKLNSS